METIVMTVYGAGGVVAEHHVKTSEDTVVENIEVRAAADVVLGSYQRAKPGAAETNRTTMISQAEGAITTLQGFRAQSQPTLAGLWPMVKYIMLVQIKLIRLQLNKLESTE